MPDAVGPVLLVSACDFGWGSLGKLRLILDELPGVAVALDDEASSTPIVRAMLGDRFDFLPCARGDATVALVINDPLAADQITSCGVPVIYVDSLPFLWATLDEVPTGVAVYCAQKYPGDTLPIAFPLAGKPIEWVDPIVPHARRWRGGGGVVVNVGGLHSHLSGSATDAYLRLVIRPLTESLGRSGQPVLAVCGNLPDWSCADLAKLLPGTERIGRQTPPVFEEILNSCDLLFTSPGSTTLVHAAALGLPTVLLPPQNLSQVLNAEIYGSGLTRRVQWPDSVLDRNELEALRPHGEDRVLEYIYAAIVAAERSADARAEVATTLLDAMSPMSLDSRLSDGLAPLGTNGASQIARIVRQALLAPLPRPTGSGTTCGESRG